VEESRSVRRSLRPAAPTGPGSFARTHLSAGAPGLPRGRSRLPHDLAHAAHRDRLIRAIVSAVHDLGFANVTIKDVVQRARVSKAVFYEHFETKKQCFLAAARLGVEVTFEDMLEATRARLEHGYEGEAVEPNSVRVIAVGMRSYLELMMEEPEFAWVYYVELPAVGTEGLALQDEAAAWFAGLTSEWHREAREAGSPWPAVPYEAFVLLVDAVTSLVGREIRLGRTGELLGVESLLLDLYATVLTGATWPEPDPSVSGDRRPPQ
jgi:AcrR family transcriptional regulator